MSASVKPSEGAKSTLKTDDSNVGIARKETLKKEESMQSTISGITEPLLDGEVKLQSTPSIDEMLSSTIDPMIQTTGCDIDLQDLLEEQEESCTLRKRSNVLATGPNGKIKLSISYNGAKEELNVTVHEAKGLPGGDLPDPPDPYVKLYLLPEKNKKSKRKSDVKKDTVNPTYDETFEYEMTAHELQQQQLEVSVVDRKGISARGALMGRAVV